MRMRRCLPAALLGLALATSALPPAEATYPGGVGRIAFGLTQPGGLNPDIYSVRPDGTGLRQLTDDPGFDACAAYDATGRDIAFCSGRTGAGTFEIWTMKADGSNERRLTYLNQRATFPDFSPSGRHVVFTLSAGAAPADIWTIRKDGSHPRPLTSTPEVDDAFPAWSPDGRSIIFLEGNAERTVSQLWIMDRNGRHQRQLTFDATVKDQLPDWRPDGKLIAYQAGSDIWLIRPDGSGQVNITNTPAVEEVGTAWSPDGRRIAYLNFAERRVYTVRRDGTDVRAVGPATGLQFVPGWQPEPRRHH